MMAQLYHHYQVLILLLEVPCGDNIGVKFKKKFNFKEKQKEKKIFYLCLTVIMCRLYVHLVSLLCDINVIQ